MVAQDLIAGIRAAQARIAPHLPWTPLLPSQLPRPAGATGRCLLKCEQLQPTGSFKLRGAINKVFALTPEQRARGVVAASTGNHGRAVAHALALAGGRGTVFIPASTPAHKVAALQGSGVEIVVHGEDSGAAEVHARAVATATGRVYVSPYNDLEVIAGQGTIGLEILAQCPEVDAIFVAVGGGGLVAGIAAAVKAARPAVQVVGCWAEHSPVMHECMQQGRVVPVRERPTLADATAGALEPGAITVPLCRELVDRTVLVSEAEIAAAIRAVFVHHHMVIEGAAGVAFAGYDRLARDYAGRSSVIVVCGANLATGKLLAILGADPRA